MSRPQPHRDLLHEPRVRAEVVALLYRSAGVSVVMNLLWLPPVWLAYRDALPVAVLLGALGGWVAMQALSAVNRRSWLRLEPAERLDAQVSLRFLRRARLMALALSVGIAVVVGVLHFARVPGAPALAAALSMAYVLAASVATMIYGAQVMTFAGVVLGSQAVLLARTGEPAHLLLAVVLLLVILGLWLYARGYSRQLQRVIQLRFEVQDLVAERERQKDAAEAANAAKSRFFAAASHDVRQPLQAAMLTFHALKHARSDAQRAEHIAVVESNLGALRQLFDQVLDVSRIDAGAVPVRPRAVALQPVFDRLDARFGLEASSRRIWLRFAPTRAAVRTDPDALERILSNLVSNALRHTHSGGVWVGLRRTRGRIEVRDSGIGVPQEEQVRIFEEFYQAGGGARDRAGGLGLGLSIVQRLAALLGHRVGVLSAPGCGSTFWIGLPLADPAQAEPAGTQAVGPALPLRGLRLWLVENDEPIRTGLVGLLQGAGAQVRAFEGAAEALQAAGEQPPADLLLCDYRLGGGTDGAEAVLRLRAQWGREVPALILTGDTGVRDLRRIDASLQAFGDNATTRLMHKPVEPQRLLAQLRALAGEAADAAG